MLTTCEPPQIENVGAGPPAARSSLPRHVKIEFRGRAELGKKLSGHGRPVQDRSRFCDDWMSRIREPEHKEQLFAEVRLAGSGNL
jgi:hypothetical protein